MDYLRAHIIMDYQFYHGLLPGDCLAAVEWEELAEHPALPYPTNRILLACLHYAHILSIHSRTDKATVSELHKAVGALADGLITGEQQYTLPPYRLNKGGEQFTIWPWQSLDAEEVRAGKKGKHVPGLGVKEYVATLNDKPGSMFGIHLKMAMGLEQVVAPGSAMFLLWTLSLELDHTDRVLLGETVRRMHEYYRTVAPYTKFLGAPAAVNTAMGFPKRGTSQVDAAAQIESDVEREARLKRAEMRGRKKGYYMVFWGGLVAISAGSGVVASILAMLGSSLFGVAIPGGPLAVAVVVGVLVFLAYRPRTAAGLQHSLERMEQQGTEEQPE